MILPANASTNTINPGSFTSSHRSYQPALICYTSLLIYRLLEKKLDDAGEHFTTDNIIETLKNMDVANVQDMYYMATYTGSRALTAINGILPLDLDRKNYLPKDLNKKIQSDIPYNFLERS